jgi:hypothetical protein
MIEAARLLIVRKSDGWMCKSSYLKEKEDVYDGKSRVR